MVIRVPEKGPPPPYHMDDDSIFIPYTGTDDIIGNEYGDKIWTVCLSLPYPPTWFWWVLGAYVAMILWIWWEMREAPTRDDW